MRLFKRILKIVLATTIVLVVTVYVLFYWYTSPKSDLQVLEAYKKKGVQLALSHEKYSGFDYRKIQAVHDTLLPTIVFVHGTIGSVMDFQSYFSDSLLLQKANMIAYDRIGYNHNDPHPVRESIAFERDMLEHVAKDIPPRKLIFVGYSYGGPIVLASHKQIHKTILIAPAVYSKVEPMPFLLNLYKWKLTRWLVPPIWKEASKEKLSHPRDLVNFEKKWNQNPNQIVSIHGDADWIVPYSNSQYLRELFSDKQFELVTLQKANHDLIWSRFTEIRNILLKQLN